MSKTYDVAVVGATGTVGRAMIEFLAARAFPIGHLYPLGNAQAVGKRVQFGDRNRSVGDVEVFDFARVQIALFAAGAELAEIHVPRAVAAGCVVIDSSLHFRQHAGVPLVAADVNADDMAGYREQGIIAMPDGASLALAAAIKPLHAQAGVERVNVATYHAVSDAGEAGVGELADQTARLLNGRAITPPQYFPKQIAFNVIPQIGGFVDNGYTHAEMRLVEETRRLLDHPQLGINPTAVQVPVFFGDALAVHLETARPMRAQQARALFEQAPGLCVIAEPADGGYATPASQSGESESVFISRIREDISRNNGLDFWIVADNVRKGAALNSVQIAEQLIETYL